MKTKKKEKEVQYDNFNKLFHVESQKHLPTPPCLEEGGEDEEDEEDGESEIFMPPNMMSNESRNIYVNGPINEKSAAYITISLNEMVNADNHNPIYMFINSIGGSAHDMFAIYDVMTIIRDHVPLYTIGLGKVMSAAVLMLAAGTKGHRYVGANTRLMIHQFRSGGYHGDFQDLTNEASEMQNMQRGYIDILADETSLSKKELEKILQNVRIDRYLDAESAIQKGIADKILKKN